MSLEDLAASERGSSRNEGRYGAAGRPRDRDREARRDDHEPYERRHDRNDRQGDGKGKGKSRLPPEEKAMLNTTCFYDAAGDMIVRLFDTDVFVLKNQAAAPKGEAKVDATVEEKAEEKAEGTHEKAEEKAEDKAGEQAEKKAVDVTAEASGATTAKSEAKADEEAKATQADGVTVVLQTGKFRTPETKYIINEALHTLYLQITEDASRQWKINPRLVDYVPPGLIDPETQNRLFEDGMVMRVKDPLARASIVKQHMEEKIREAKACESERARAAARPPPHHAPYGAYPPLGYGLPPPGYPLYGPPGYPLYALPPPGYGAPPGYPRAAATRPPPWAIYPPPGYGGPPPGYDPRGAPLGGLGGRADAPRAAPAPAPAPAPGGGGERPRRSSGVPPAQAPPRGPLPDSMFQ